MMSNKEAIRIIHNETGKASIPNISKSIDPLPNDRKYIKKELKRIKMKALTIGSGKESAKKLIKMRRANKTIGITASVCISLTKIPKYAIMEKAASKITLGIHKALLSFAFKWFSLK
jgi:hypothetical protein